MIDGHSGNSDMPEDNVSLCKNLCVCAQPMQMVLPSDSLFVLQVAGLLTTSAPVNTGISCGSSYL